MAIFYHHRVSLCYAGLRLDGRDPWIVIPDYIFPAVDNIGGERLSSKITYVTLIADETIHPKYEEALARVEKDLLGKRYPMYIGGREIYSERGEFEKRSPIDIDIVVGRFQKGSRDHALEAIKNAHEAFKEWGESDWKERVRIFRKIADLLERRAFDLAAAITYEVGKNRLEAIAEVYEAIDAIRYYTDLMERENGYVRRMMPGAPGEETWSIPRPYGVWVVISPFNFPLMLANGMMLGALLTGNTVVWKPTSEAPLTATLLHSIYIDGGIPPGVLNLVTGSGEEFEDVFVSNKLVGGIAFTGSRDVGMRLYRRFTTEQPYPKPIVLEMGSKNPTIVTSKADLDKAVEGTVRAAFGYGGQKCSATSRLYVEKSIKDEFVSRLVERVKRIVVGDPRKREVFLGPVINRRALESFKRYVEDAVASGGRILVGGKVLQGGIFSKGFYVEPTVIEGVPEDHYLWRQELFLPILLVSEFRTLEEALEKANNTEYGLTAGIFSEDENEIQYFFSKIEFGVTYANRRGGSTTGAWPGAQTFVGWKASGATGRGVGGPYYLLNYFREQARTIVRETKG
ncbi:MAG: aldehyde dehydrogenase family protein [Sulfolobales archaeon]